MYIGLPAFYGSWLQFIYGHTQHAGLAENVLDHRLNSRTIYMNAVNRYLYWEMNYHVEHHMFPLVPYHNLAKLHELVKADMPKPYNGLLEAWREIIPAVFRQVKDPTYYVQAGAAHADASAPTPRPRRTFSPPRASRSNGWVEICASSFLRKEDVIRFDHEGKTYAVYRTADGKLYATDGICTHGNAHLADGFVSGTLIECAKHNGRFDITDGSPRRLPVCVGAEDLQGPRTRREDLPRPQFRRRLRRSRSAPPPTDSASSATTTSPPSSRNSFWNPSPARRCSITSRATTCSSTSRPTTKSRSAKSP